MVKALVAATVVIGLSLAVPVVSAAPAQPKVEQPKPARPDWAELTSGQQSVLAPLKDTWSELDTTRRTKWAKIANAYPKMKPEQQQRLQAQMLEWAKLTPEQRRIARENYKTKKGE